MYDGAVKVCVFCCVSFAALSLFQKARKSPGNEDESFIETFYFVYRKSSNKRPGRLFYFSDLKGASIRGEAFIIP